MGMVVLCTVLQFQIYNGTVLAGSRKKTFQIYKALLESPFSNRSILRSSAATVAGCCGQDEPRNLGGNKDRVRLYSCSCYLLLVV
jgi:hypothetical protein